MILSLWLGYEALERLACSGSGGGKLDDLDVAGGAGGERGNHAGAGARPHDLNLRSILVHNFGDALSNIAIIVGAIVIRMTGAVGSILCWDWRLVYWCCGRASGSCANRRTFCWKGVRKA